MNNTLKKGLMFLSMLLISSHMSYSQETLFEFGTSTSMDAVLSKAKEKENKLKWVNVNTTKETWKFSYGPDSALGGRRLLHRRDRQARCCSVREVS